MWGEGGGGGGKKKVKVIFPNSTFFLISFRFFLFIRLLKSSLKKDRAILSKTLGSRNYVFWC